MKVCVIGASHLWALRAARDDYRARAGVRAIDFVFWGVPGPQLRSVKFDGRSLIAADPTVPRHLSDGKYEAIAPAEFDAAVFHAYALHLNKLLHVVFCRLGGMSSVSGAFLREGIVSHLAVDPSCRLLDQVRAVCPRVLLSLPPLISEASALYSGSGVVPDARKTIDSLIREYFEPRGIEYVPQPAHTVVDGRYTAARFNNAAKLANGSIDYRHMNPLYGLEMLQAIADKLQS